MKPILVGESNPYGSDPRYALYPYPDGCSGDRLARQILGMSREHYLEVFDRVNLCGGGWSKWLADMSAARLASEGRRLILLGSKVSGSFGFAFEPFSKPVRGVLIMPHPSGRCRLWNDGVNIQRAREAVSEFVPEAYQERK